MPEPPRHDTLELTHDLGLANLEAIAWAILGLVALDGLCVVVFGAAPRGLVDFLFAVLVMHAALRTALSGGRVRGLAAALTPEGRLPWAFLLRTALLIAPGFLAFMLVGGLLAPTMGIEGALIVGVTVSIAVQAVTLALFGIMLVDIAGSGPGDAEAAMAKGRRHLTVILTMMLTGPAAVEIAVFLTRRAFIGLGTGDRVAVPGAAHIDPLGLILDVATLTGAAVVSLMTAAVLLRAARLPN